MLACSALLLENKTKTLLPSILYPAILRERDLCSAPLVVLIDGRRYCPLTSHSPASLPPVNPYTNSVVCSMFAQWQSSLKGRHFTLGPSPLAPPSTEQLSSTCNKSAFPFTGSFAFHSVLATGSLVGLPASDHSPWCEDSFLKHSTLLEALFSKSWHQTPVSLSESEPSAPALCLINQ